MGLSEEDFNAAIIKLLQEVIKSSIETNVKVENLRKQAFLKESKEKFRTGKYNHQNKNKHWV